MLPGVDAGHRQQEEGGKLPGPRLAHGVTCPRGRLGKLFPLAHVAASALRLQRIRAGHGLVGFPLKYLVCHTPCNIAAKPPCCATDAPRIGLELPLELCLLNHAL